MAWFMPANAQSNKLSWLPIHPKYKDLNVDVLKNLGRSHSKFCEALEELRRLGTFNSWAFKWKPFHSGSQRMRFSWFFFTTPHSQSTFQWDWLISKMLNKSALQNIKGKSILTCQRLDVQLSYLFFACFFFFSFIFLLLFSFSMNGTKSFN